MKPYNELTPPDQHNYVQEPYYIDANMVEHGCCWAAAIVRKCKPGTGNYGKDVELICECDEKYAEIICDALNAALKGGNK